MILIYMQYFGGNGAASGKGSGGGKAGGGAAAKVNKSEELQAEFDKASNFDKISMLRNNEEATEEGEALWEHAKSQGKVVQVASQSSKGDYIRENKEYVKGNNSLAAQTDAVRNNNGESSFIYRGSKGNLYMATYDVRGGGFKKTLRLLPWK